MLRGWWEGCVRARVGLLDVAGCIRTLPPHNVTELTKQWTQRVQLGTCDAFLRPAHWRQRRRLDCHQPGPAAWRRLGLGETFGAECSFELIVLYGAGAVGVDLLRA